MIRQGRRELHSVQMSPEREASEKERDQWKANHDNQRDLKRVLMDRPDLQDRANSMVKLQNELLVAKKFQVVCPNCKTSEHLHHAGSGWWCNMCGGGEVQKELLIESLREQIRNEQLCHQSTEKVAKDIRKRLLAAQADNVRLRNSITRIKDNQTAVYENNNLTVTDAMDVHSVLEICEEALEVTIGTAEIEQVREALNIGFELAMGHVADCEVKSESFQERAKRWAKQMIAALALFGGKEKE